MTIEVQYMPIKDSIDKTYVASRTHEDISAIDCTRGGFVILYSNGKFVAMYSRENLISILEFGGNTDIEISTT